MTIGKELPTLLKCYNLSKNYFILRKTVCVLCVGVLAIMCDKTVNIRQSTRIHVPFHLIPQATSLREHQIWQHKIPRGRPRATYNESSIQWTSRPNYLTTCEKNIRTEQAAGLQLLKKFSALFQRKLSSFSTRLRTGPYPNNLNLVHAATAYYFKVYSDTYISPEKVKSHPGMYSQWKKKKKKNSPPRLTYP